MREQVAGSEAQRSLGGQERVQGLDLVVCFDLIFEARLILSGRFTQMGKTWMKHIPPSCALISPLRKEVGREQNLTYSSVCPCHSQWLCLTTEHLEMLSGVPF